MSCGKNVEERIRKYQAMVEDAIRQARDQFGKIGERERELVDLADMYLRDSKYYLGIGDHVTSLATVSYAEGLLDSLNRMGLIHIEWRRENPIRVVAAGTFDIIHPGHIIMLREAARLGELYVIVSRDKNARKSKGRETVFPEESRVFIVDNLKPVKKAVLGDEEDILKRVVELEPDVLFLGPDQRIDEKWLREELDRRGLKKTRIVRMNKREEKYYPSSSTQVILDVMKKFCLREEPGSTNENPHP